MGKRAIYDANTGLTEIVEELDEEEIVEPQIVATPTDSERIAAVEAALLDILMGG